MAAHSEPDTAREVIITRVFDAPRELVFKAWTQPEHVAQWWSPHHFTIPVCEVDARPGGALVLHMAAPDGTVYPMKGTFHEVVSPERLVLATATLEDADGNPQLEVLNTITFDEVDGKTKLTMHAVVVKATAEAQGALAGMEEGWNQSFEKLAAHLANV